MSTRCVVLVVIACLWASSAQTQTLTLNVDRVAPGTGVVVTLTGQAGQNYAVVGSPVGAGLVVLGIPMQVGPDFVILAMGVLDSNGQATTTIVPPFVGTTLDRFYLQAGVSPSPTFNPLLVSQGAIVKNQDLIGPLPQVLYVYGGMVPNTSVARALCPQGMKVSGGGGLSPSGAGLQQNYPIADETGLIAHGSTAIGWQVAATDWSPVQAFVVCVAP
jgi:hypothetical protein